MGRVCTDSIADGAVDAGLGMCAGILWALGGMTLAGSVAFCVVSESVVDMQASTAVTGAWGCLDGIASSRSGSCASCGVTLWTKYSAHSSGSAVNLAAALNCCAKFDLRIRSGAPIATS